MHDETSQVRRRRRFYWIAASVIATLLTAAAGPAYAQATDTQKAEPSGEKPTARTHPQNPELWDVEQMMEEAVLQISRRYNLNKAQENYTRMLLKERVRSFLDEYEDDVRQLLAESIRLQTRPQDATIQDYMDWAQRARPVYDAAQTAILNGNSEWREILDEQQKQIHDRDLDQMMRNFDQVSRVMEQWEEGRGVAVGNTNAPKGATGTVPEKRQPPVIERKNPEDNWMMYVNKFIQVYQFDDKQANAARAKIHKEFHDKAVAYRDRKKKQFETINAELSDPKFDKDHKERPRKLLEKRRELEQPIHVLFLQMDKRLLMLADSKQLAAADEAGKKELERLKATFSGEMIQEKLGKNRGVTARPDPKPDSENTTTAPAAAPAAAPKKADEKPASDGDSKPPAAAEAKPEKPAEESADAKAQEPAKKPAAKEPPETEKPAEPPAKKAD